jgi:hypothetical protein
MRFSTLSFYSSNPLRPLTNGLKPFRIWFRIRRDICFKSRQIRSQEPFCYGVVLWQETLCHYTGGVLLWSRLVKKTLLKSLVFAPVKIGAVYWFLSFITVCYLNGKMCTVPVWGRQFIPVCVARMVWNFFNIGSKFSGIARNIVLV